MAQYLQDSELDIDGQLNALKAWMSNQAIFQDYNFDGANFSTLLGLLTTNTLKNATYLNYAGAEAYLDSAQKRNSINSRVKELNYLPRSTTSANAIGTIQASVSNTQIAQILIPSGTQFNGQANNFNYLFQTQEDIILLASNNYIVGNCTIVEGFPVTEQFTATGNTFGQLYTITNDTVDLDTLNITVLVSNTNQQNTVFTYTDSLVGLVSNSNVYFLQPGFDTKYQIYFGDGIFGTKLIAGNVVRASYLVSSGSDPNGIAFFTPTQTNIGGINNSITFTTTTPAAGGAPQEDLTTIKFYAPKLAQAQGRGITAPDYQALIADNFTEIQSINVFGGEQVNPPQYGKVLISASTYAGTTLTNSRKSDVINFLSTRSNLQIAPQFIDPDYTYIEVTTNINYKKDLNISNQKQVIKQAVQAAIQSYNDDNLGVFNAVFRYSKFTAAIDDADVNIWGNNTTVYLKKRVNAFPNQSQSFVINFYTPLNQIPIDDSFYPTITSSTFIINGYTCYLSDDGNSVLNIYTETPTGQSVVKSGIGAVNYQTGAVSITGLFAQSYTNGLLTLTAQPASNDITSAQNVILEIDIPNVVSTLTVQ